MTEQNESTLGASELSDQLGGVKLERCPFCGRNATMVMHPGMNWDGKAGEHINIGALHGLWYVGCSYGFFEDMDMLPDCEIKPNGGWWARIEDGIRAWNRRVT